MCFLKPLMMRNSFLCTEHGSKRGDREECGNKGDTLRPWKSLEENKPGGQERPHGGGHMGASQQVIWAPL